MSGGAWSNDSTSTLVIPTGATTGARIVLNGVTGQIQVFDATNALVGQIDSAGIVALGTDGSLVRMYDLAGIARLGLLPGGGNVNEASVIAGVSAGQPQLVIRSPQQTSTSPNNQGLILLTGASAALPATIQVTGDSVNLSGNNSSVNVGGIGSGPGQAAITTPNTSIGLDGGGSSVLNDIALTANLIDLICNEVDLNFVRARMLVFGETFPLTLALTLTGVNQNILFGASTPSGVVPSGTGVITVTTQKPKARYEVTLWTDASINTAGDVTVADLAVDSALIPGEPIFAVTGATGRSTVSQGWQGEFAAAGNHTFQATGKRAAGAGVTDVFNSVHTKIRINIYE